MTNTLLSLFDETGVWSNPYRRRGWNVVQIDLALGADVMDITMQWLDSISPIKGIISAPPCTDFTRAGAWNWKWKDKHGLTKNSIGLVKRVLSIVEYVKPEFWALENPPGRIMRLVPELEAVPLFWFQPWWYAGYSSNPHSENYSKKTGLWGHFNQNLPRYELTRLEKVNGNWTKQRVQTFTEKFNSRRSDRSRTPEGFSEAFYRANN